MAQYLMIHHQGHVWSPDNSNVLEIEENEVLIRVKARLTWKEMGYWRIDNYSSYQEGEKFGYKGKEVKAVFEDADKEIPNISASYEKDPDAVYTSRVFTFNNLPKPVNSSIITSYLNEEENNKGTYITFQNYFLITNVCCFNRFPRFSNSWLGSF